jgi:hypothetical protein
MPRAVPLRLTAALVLLPIAALLSAECGGNDVVDPSDASMDAAAFDRASDDGVGDGPPGATDGDSSSEDASALDAEAQDGAKARDGGGFDAADTGLEGGHAAALALGAAASFALLASDTITNVGVTTAITGDVGISPGTALVNLPPGQVTGTIYLDVPPATQAEFDLGVAYEDLAARPCQHTMSGSDLGGATLGPGVYCFGVAAAQSAADLNLDGQGDPNAVWIFQIGSTLTIANNAVTNMIGGGNACNVYWQVGSSATINTGARFKGSILASASVTMLTGASVSPGRVMAETAAITLDTNAISSAGCP